MAYHLLASLKFFLTPTPLKYAWPRYAADQTEPEPTPILAASKALLAASFDPSLEKHWPINSSSASTESCRSLSIKLSFWRRTLMYRSLSCTLRYSTQRVTEGVPQPIMEAKLLANPAALLKSADSRSNSGSNHSRRGSRNSAPRTGTDRHGYSAVSIRICIVYRTIVNEPIEINPPIFFKRIPIWSD